MLLSMWIIADKLSHYDLIVNIKEGSDTISGIRFFAVELGEFHEDNLYIGSASHIFSDDRFSDAVLLVHRYDIILVLSQGLEAVLNEILSIIDYYNRWEATLWETSSEPNALRKIVELSEAILPGPAYISDSFGNILALTESYGPDNVNHLWKSIYNKRVLPLSTSSAPIICADGNYVDDLSSKPQVYRSFYGTHDYIAAHIMSDDEVLCGIAVMEHGKPFTAGDLQIVSVMSTVIKATIKNSDIETALPSSQVLSNILVGIPTHEELLMKHCQKIHIDKPWIILSIRNLVTGSNVTRKNILLKAIKNSGTSTIITTHQQDIVALISCERLEVFLKELSFLIVQNYYSIGISLPFYQQDNIQMGYKQSQFALEQSKEKHGIYNFRDYTYLHMLAMLREKNHDMEVSHPVLGFLKNYDLENNTELYMSLHYYLMHERNATKAAEALNVHRNTMYARIVKLVELLDDIDLENPDTRMSILLSYLIDLDEVSDK